MSLSVDIIPNRSSPPAILLREAWREGTRIRRRTLVNLSKMPPALVDAVRAAIKGGVMFPSIDAAVTIRRSLPHGHVAAVLGTFRALGLVRILGRKADRRRDLAIAAIVARIIDPASKLATARALSPATASTSLGGVLQLGVVSGNEMLAMLDWLLGRQAWIEKSLASRHLTDGTLILYDVSSSDVEGRCCPLAAFGHNRDGKAGKQQIVYGLLCAAHGCPIAVEVFAGHTADPATVATQVDRVRRRFGIDRVAVVGDRGMVTTARIRGDLAPAGLDWISALTTRDIRKLLRAGGDGEVPPLVPEALIDDAVAEITSPDFPGERLMVCLNPRLRDERRRKRDALLHATEEILAQIAAAVRSGRIRNPQEINRRVGRDLNRRKVGKHFAVTVAEGSLAWQRRQTQIDAEARLDGIYVIRTSLKTDAINAAGAVWAYKNLAHVERAFRQAKSDLKIRPIPVYSADHVKAHIFLSLSKLDVEWHMRQRLAPILFEDADRDGARAQRSTPVAPATVSESAKAKANSKWTADGIPAHSFRTLLADLATLTLNEVTLPNNPNHAFPMLAQPTDVQTRAFDLLKIDPAQHVAMSMTG
ncbi:MAG: transposase [Rhodobacteraceae bacterium]|nr:transposase [Paracoccaceae bacterium]